jgi:hypothetical protein
MQTQFEPSSTHSRSIYFSRDALGFRFGAVLQKLARLHPYRNMRLTVYY